MTDHKALPVVGYKPQSDEKVALVNVNKRVEETMLRMLDTLKDNSEVDQRWLAIGRTQLELAWMAVNRAIFKPGRAKLENE